MNYKKLIIAAILVTIFNVILGMLTCGCVFSWVYKLEPTNVWKPMTNYFPLVSILSTFILDLIFVAVYALINKGIPGQNKYVKGLVYGLLVWLVGMVPGMVSTYIFMTVATGVVIYWTIWALVAFPVKGLIAAAIYGE